MRPHCSSRSRLVLLHFAVPSTVFVRCCHTSHPKLQFLISADSDLSDPHRSPRSHCYPYWRRISSLPSALKAKQILTKAPFTIGRTTACDCLRSCTKYTVKKQSQAIARPIVKAPLTVTDVLHAHHLIIKDTWIVMMGHLLYSGNHLYSWKFISCDLDAFLSRVGSHFDVNNIKYNITDI